VNKIYCLLRNAYIALVVSYPTRSLKERIFVGVIGLSAFVLITLTILLMLDTFIS
jgi:hypothetical protein